MSDHPAAAAPEDEVVWFEDEARPVVAIDGPAGSGKSTVAVRVAEALDVPHVDTGALYRAATLACLRAGVDLSDGATCTSVVVASRIDRDDTAGRTYLDGEDVEAEIRGPEVTAAVSELSSHHGVRSALTPAQRRAVANGGVVEGRDIGTVVLPDADVKVFLTASADERARRRAAQLGRDDLAALTAEMAARDDADGSRQVAPLVRADDAWELNTDGLDVDEVVDLIVARVAEVTAGVDLEEAAARPVVDPLTARRALPRVAVVGRPNVGKSTLVNRVLGRRVTIVEEKPGVTRDRTEHRAEWIGRPFLIVDTGGWEHAASSAGRDRGASSAGREGPVAGMSARIVEQAEAAIASADLVLFVVDATVGALEDDERYAKLLRRSGVPTVLVANKVDSDRQEPLVHELWNLGLEEPHPVSARHGRGLGEVLDTVVELLPAPPEDLAGAISDEAAVPRVALVGKPNVGKSSLFNRLLGEERSIVDAVPHTTRDAVDTMVEVDGEPWVFVDTAGMRRRYRTGEDTELFSVDRTRAAIEQADLVLFVLDASEPLGEQDQRLAALLRDAGRGVVLVCNKWDLVDDQRREDLEKELDRLLSFARWAPRINISATSGRGLRRVMPQLRSVWGNYRRRVPTRELNRLFADAVAHQSPPRRGQKQLKLRYATQAETRPPRFVLFTNGTLPPGYKRYLERELRETHDFTGVPLLLDDRPPAQRENKRDRRRGAR